MVVVEIIGDTVIAVLEVVMIGVTVMALEEEVGGIHLPECLSHFLPQQSLLLSHLPPTFLH